MIFRIVNGKLCHRVKSNIMVLPSCLLHVLTAYIRRQVDKVLKWAVVYLWF